MGLNYLPEGKALIERILQQMNNYRLSTNTTHSKVDRTLLLGDLAKLLSVRSNYEIKEGKTYIKSLNIYLKEIPNKAQPVKIVATSNHNIISTFNSFNDCAKILGVSKSTVHNRLKNKAQFEEYFHLYNLCKHLRSYQVGRCQQ